MQSYNFQQLILNITSYSENANFIYILMRKTYILVDFFRIGKKPVQNGLCLMLKKTK